MNSVHKLGKNLAQQLKLQNYSPYFIFQQNRSVALYGPTNLGVDKYCQARETFVERMGELMGNFKTKMLAFTKEGSTNIIFTEDLKSMVHLCTPEDVDLLEKMMIKFNTQNKELKFGNYVFGPVIMRLYYALDLPNEAYKVFKEPSLSGFFDQFMSYHILMDLLYKHNMFDEVMDVFEYVRIKQTDASKYPKHIVVLAMGALYKKNTEESLKQATKIWSDLNSVGIMPMRRAAAFFSALALNQNASHIALEVLSAIKNQHYYMIRNLKIYALSELNRPEDALPILRTALEFDGPREHPSEFLQEVMERLQAAAERSNNSDIKREYLHLMKGLMDRNAIDKKNTLDDYLSKEMTVTQPLTRSQMDNSQLQNSFSGNNRTQYASRRPVNSRFNASNRSGLADRY